jgi:hypothetical protein
MDPNKYLDWLKADLEKLEEKVDEHFDTLDEKMDKMLEIKWQITGASAVFSFVIGLIIQVIMAKLG